MQSDYQLLIAKLDAFIRKYYKDRLIRGALYAVGLIVSLFLLTALLEHLGQFGTTPRTLLFWGFILCMAIVLGRFVAHPLVKLFRLGSIISHEEAARIIGAHFGDVRDKLLNTLQLHDLAIADSSRRELIGAAIAQRSRELGPVPFVRAIDLRRNGRYMRYALVPLSLLLLILFAAPSLITGPTQRILRHGSEFLPEAPFRFVLLNDSLVVSENQDFELLLAIEGDPIPSRVTVEIGAASIPMVQQSAGRFAHRFRNVQANADFRFAADGFKSREFTLRTQANPVIIGLSASLDYPQYLGLPAGVERTAGDMTVPAGTRITWTATAQSADELRMDFEDTLLVSSPLPAESGQALFSMSRRMLQSQTYVLQPMLQGRPGSEPLKHRIEVVPDLYPAITVRASQDSAALRRMYFSGEVGDDYGLRSLLFHYRFVQGGDSVPVEKRQGHMTIALDPRTTRQGFMHTWDMYDLLLVPGDRVEHWFEVWDNDGVNGSKSTRTAVMVFAAPSLKELSERQEAQSEASKNLFRENIKEAQELQRELEKLRRDLLEKKEADWQDKQRLQQVLDRQKQLEQRIEQSVEQMQQSQQERQEFSPLDERLLEKQQRIQELFENVLSEEMKELYRKVEELMQRIDKSQLEEQLREMKLGQEDVEKELDRALELFKRMEVEQKAEDIAKRLRELSEKQERLSEETKDGNRPGDELKQKQEALNEEFKELREEMDKLTEKNQELEQPMNLPDTDSKEQEIQDQQKRSADNLDRKQNQKASGEQKGAAENMEQLAHQMESAMQGNAQEQQEEDMDALRQLLENIIHMSFSQEDLMNNLTATNVRDPRWVDHGRLQRKLRDKAKVIEDSLFALSKRVPQIQGTVNREMNAVNDNMDEARRLIGEARANERFKPGAADKQQRAMTSLNNLALLLDEALQQMMQQMNAQSKPGSGSCNKPGKKPGEQSGNKPSMSKARSQQQALQKQLEEMRKAMEQGKKPGEQRGQGTMGMPGMSQQLANLAAQQAAIRKEMQRLAQDLNKDGSGAGNEINKLAQQMEQQEKDIVNKNITPETLRRQQDLLVRLLEHEKAERERELDQKRTSNEGRDSPPVDPARAFEHKRRKAQESELLRTIPPGLKPYYRDRVNAYFGTFDRP